MEDFALRPSHVEAVALARLAPRAKADLRGPGEALITGASVDSRTVRRGDLFGALPGLKVHGALYAAEAVRQGAFAILTDDEGARIAQSLGIPMLIAQEPRVAIGEAAAAVYGDPSHRLTLVGVTGTNGKTTTSYLVDAALRRVHPKTGILGTIELKVADKAVESPRTTVESPVLQGLLARMLEEGCSAATAEVSSHAAALHRISGTEFSVAVFTNLQWDHLDFHETMDGYFADKARLFNPGRSKKGVVCIDDEYGVTLVSQAKIPVVTVATRAANPAADWTVASADVGLDGIGSSFELVGPGRTSFEAFCPLPGVVNVSNAALAIVAAVEAGVSVEEAIAGVASARAVPGRMERVIERSADDPLAIVDYAHTPDALTLALEGVRPITPGRLVLVFGSDGDRDQGKRPVMGEIAARLADVIVLTDENPRSEDPAAIRAAIKEGIKKVRPGLDGVEEVSPRWDAVGRGLEIAGPEDTVIVTGKGHEPTQEIAGVFHRYNDRDAFRAAHDRIVKARESGSKGPEDGGRT